VSHVGDYNQISWARYVANGALDRTYADAGYVFLEVDGGDDYGAFDLALQSVGTVFDTGSALVRATPAGKLDPSFGDGGWSTYPGGQSAHIVRGPTDDSLYVSGQSCGDGFCQNFANSVLKYTPLGAIDNTFGQGGAAGLPVKSGQPFGDVSFVFDATGRIVTAASSTEQADGGLYSLYLDVVRVEADGALDTSFGQGGGVEVSLGVVSCNDGCGYPRLGLQPDGRIVVADTSNTAGGTPVAVLLRFTDNGSVDTSFGLGGTVTYSAEPNVATYAVDVVIQSSGAIVLGGNIVPDDADETMLGADTTLHPCSGLNWADSSA
jgi:uncharacterized delta-60 repeat protein